VAHIGRESQKAEEKGSSGEARICHHFGEEKKRNWCPFHHEKGQEGKRGGLGKRVALPWRKKVPSSEEIRKEGLWE